MNYNKNIENNSNYIHALIASGLSIIPIADGKKTPHFILGKKHNLLEERGSSEDVEKWIVADVRSWGIAGGKVSRNLVTLDFDEKHYPCLYDLWYARLSSDQKKIVDLCHKNHTRNNGTHLHYRTTTPKPTQKLTRCVEFNKEEGKEIIVTTAETKAEGGYALIPPTNGYTTVQGSLLELPLVTDEMHEELIDVLRTFNQVFDEPATEYEWKSTDAVVGDRPGDRFNASATWNQILEPSGWVEESKNHWRRPGKKEGEGISATTDYEGIPMLYVFSSSAHPFVENKGYSKFHAFALLNHGGDFKAAAALVAETYPDDNSIEPIEKMLQQIPSDTPKVKISEVLSPVLTKLLRVDKITAETFILYNVKEFFSITKEEAKKYITRLNSLRIEAVKKAKAKKTERQIPLIVDRDIDFQEAYDAVLEIGIVNKEIFRVITAIVISARLRLNPPLWLMLIGVPSSFKTELVGLYEAIEAVFTLDTLTENAFASGYVPPDGSETQDMLPLLDNKCLIIKDLNTLFSMNEEMVKKILGDLTSIFDGKFEKFTATRGMISYNSLFSMIGCITPSILIKHYNYATQLGPRFFFLRVPDLTKDELNAGLQKSWTDTNRSEKIVQARTLVSSYCTQLIKKISQYKSSPETKEFQEMINNMALFICQARGVAISKSSTFKDKEGNDVTYYAISDWQVEQPWRILNQIKALLRVLSFINGKDTVGKEEINTIKPIVLSTMPVDRAEILKILSLKCGLSVKDLSQEIGKSNKTIRRTLKELEALKLVDSYRDPKMNMVGQAPWLFFIPSEYASILHAPMPSPESVSQSKLNSGHVQTETEDDDD